MSHRQRKFSLKFKRGISLSSSSQYFGALEVDVLAGKLSHCQNWNCLDTVEIPAVLRFGSRVNLPGVITYLPFGGKLNKGIYYSLNFRTEPHRSYYKSCKFLDLRDYLLNWILFIVFCHTLLVVKMPIVLYNLTSRIYVTDISGNLNENFNFNFVQNTYLKSIVKWL